MGDKYKHVFWRYAEDHLRESFTKPYVHMLFGARQTGKTTLLRQLLPKDALNINLANPAERSRFAANPDTFVQLCKALPKGRKAQFVWVDEAQVVPAIFDGVQYLYDEDKTRWRFVLSGSSARKLRRMGANLLPGRSMIHRLYPLILAEYAFASQDLKESVVPLPALKKMRPAEERLFPKVDLESHLAFGDLPGIVTAPLKDRADLLASYATIYLEEEIRREALVKDWGAFVRFLRLAAAESGGIVNYANISKESGISQPTIKSYYQLLEDMFVGFFVPAFSKSPRKNLLSSPRFFFFDLGVRHAAAGLSPDVNIVRVSSGEFFEQWVAIELYKRLHYVKNGNLSYFRTKDGAEVDFIIETPHEIIPVEVKWTQMPSSKDIRNLKVFMAEHPKKATRGFVVCRTPSPLQLDHKITAIPWSYL